MTQKTDKIAGLLRDLENINLSASEKFEELLNNISEKIITENDNSKVINLLKEYLNLLAKTEYEKYSILLSKFKNIEESLKLIIRGSYDHTQAQNVILTFNDCLKAFGSEQEVKELSQSIELALVKINLYDKESKEEIVSAIKTELSEISALTKEAVSVVETELRQIMDNFDLYVIKKMSDKSASKVDLMIKDLQIINNYITSSTRRNDMINGLVEEVISNENLKTAEGFSGIITDKINEIAEKLTLTNVQGNDAKNIELINQLSDSFTSQINKVKEDLAQVSQNTNGIKELETSLKDLYLKSNEIENSLNNITSKQEINTLNEKIEFFGTEIETIKKIIEDLEEVTYSKVISTINDISFENESYDIKNHVSKMLTQLPQKEDIEKILIDGEYANKGIDEINDRTKTIDEKVDYLATKENADILEKGQQKISEKLLEIADKEDVENLGQEAHEIKQMIGNINFDDEFKNIYDKASNIEDWLIDSKVKENSEEIIKTLDSKAEKNEVQKVLDIVNEITTNVQNLIDNPDSIMVRKVMEDSYRKIEALKIEFLNTTDFHNGNILLKLEELQNSVCGITTGEEFTEFVNDLKTFTTQIIKDNENLTSEIKENKEIQKQILDKIEELDFSGTVNRLNNNFESFAGDIQRTVESSNTEFYQKIIDVENKLTSLSEFLSQTKSEKPDEIVQTIEDIKTDIEQTERDFSGIQEMKSGQIEEIRNYLEIIQELFESTQFGLTPEIEEKIISIEKDLIDYKEIGNNKFENILDRLNECISIISNDSATEDIKTSIKEILDIKENLKELGQTFESIASDNNQKTMQITDFVSKKLFELSENLEDMTYEIKDGFQQGFAYTAELIEEKNSTLLEFIKELRHSNTDNIELYERLTVTDNKLMDIKQELQLINADVTNNMNSKSEVILKELSPIREMVSDFSNRLLSEQSNIKLIDNLEALHLEISSELKRTSESSRAAFKKVDELYEDLFSHLSNMEKRLRDFINRDFESFLSRVDILKDSIESLNDVVIPIAGEMREFHEFAQEIKEFKQEQSEFIQEVVADIKTTINTTMETQHNEIKSMLTVAINNEAIIQQIEQLKESFQGKLDEITNIQKVAEENFDNQISEFGSHFENFDSKIENFRDSKTEKIIADMKDEFNGFSSLISKLSGDSTEILNVLNNLRDKIDTISVKSDSGNEKIAVAENDFDFIRAFELLKQDISNLKEELGHALPPIEELTPIQASGNDTNILLNDLNEKIENISNNLQKNWLEEIKDYISGNDNVHIILEEINSKIDNLAINGGSEWVQEIKDALENYENNRAEYDDKEIREMLEALNLKLDILSSDENIATQFEEIKGLIVRLNYENVEEQSKSNEEIKKLVAIINEKLDVISQSDDSFNITMMLEDLNHKIDIISSNDGKDTQKDIDDVKKLIKDQMTYIDKIGKNDETIETFKKCLGELTNEVNNLNDREEVQKTLKDMKDSIMSAVVKIFGQVSFIEESEDIKDFVEEKTDVINKNLVEVTKQLKQIAKSTDDEGAIYSMQDIESDLAKLRLALNEVQDNTNSNSTINETLNRITGSVEKLESAMTPDEIHELKYDIANLQGEVQRILITSGESYNALSSGMDAFGQIVTTQISQKVDNVTKLLQKTTDSDKVMRQALIYMGEWIDSASVSMNKISSNSDELKTSIENLKSSMPEQTDILNSIEEKSEQQKDKLKTLEKQINKVSNLEERIDRLESLLDKVLTLVEEMDDSRVTRRIDRLEKQLNKLSVNIEKLTAYVD